LEPKDTLERSLKKRKAINQSVEPHSSANLETTEIVIKNLKNIKRTRKGSCPKNKKSRLSRRLRLLANLKAKS